MRSRKLWFFLLVTSSVSELTGLGCCRTGKARFLQVGDSQFLHPASSSFSSGASVFKTIFKGPGSGASPWEQLSGGKNGQHSCAVVDGWRCGSVSLRGPKGSARTRDGDRLPDTQGLPLLHCHNVNFFTLCPKRSTEETHPMRNTYTDPMLEFGKGGDIFEFRYKQIHVGRRDN